ncbi:MAG: RidA family protein [Gemmatimonadaceae bacterium]
MRRFTLVAGLLAMSAAACQHNAGTGASPEFFPVAGPVARPFSAAVRVGDMLYLAGQIGTGSDGQIVSGGIAAETKQAMTNISQVLAQHGSSLDRVVRCTVMMADMREWDAMNAVYSPFFPSHKPARSSFGTSGLALNARVEIECTAVVSA